MKKVFKEISTALDTELGLFSELDDHGFLTIHSGPDNTHAIIAHLLPPDEIGSEDMGISVEINGTDPWTMTSVVLLISQIVDLILMEPVFYSLIDEELFYGEDAFKKYQEDTAQEKDMLINESIRANSQLKHIYKKTNKGKKDLN